MAESEKAPRTRMNELVSIPMNAEQKRLIVRAGTAKNPRGFTPWARDVLLRAAARELKRKDLAVKSPRP